MRDFDLLLLHWQMHHASMLQRVGQVQLQVSLAYLMERMKGDSDGTIWREYVVVLPPIMFSREVEQDWGPGSKTGPNQASAGQH